MDEHVKAKSQLSDVPGVSNPNPQCSAITENSSLLINGQCNGCDAEAARFCLTTNADNEVHHARLDPYVVARCACIASSARSSVDDLLSLKNKDGTNVIGNSPLASSLVNCLDGGLCSTVGFVTQNAVNAIKHCNTDNVCDNIMTGLVKTRHSVRVTNTTQVCAIHSINLGSDDHTLVPPKTNPTTADDDTLVPTNKNPTTAAPVTFNSNKGTIILAKLGLSNVSHKNLMIGAAVAVVVCIVLLFIWHRHGRES